MIPEDRFPVRPPQGKRITVVPFSDTHQSGVVDVILPIQQAEFGIPITLAQQPDLSDIPGFYQQKTGNFWVALDKADVIGTIALVDIGNGQGALRKMFVKPPYRGRESGVAQALLRALMDWCRAHRLTVLYLGTTDKFKAAHRFYEKNGFTEISRENLPGSFPVMAVDTKFYTCSLT